MQKLLLTWLFALISCYPLLAQSAAPAQLVVELKSGEVITFALQQRPVLTFTGNTLHIQTPESDYQAELPQIKLYRFRDVSTGIEQTKETPSTKISEDVIELQGAKAHASVVLYHLNGQVLKKVHTDAQGRAQLSLQGLPVGTYILRTPTTTLKFIHR